jgi:nucleotide-binding universal stress UspA family protein
MYKMIMCPTDGSGFDREAIRVALRIAERSQAKVRLVRVHCIGAFFGMESGPEAATVSVKVLEQERDRILDELHDLAAECRATSGAEIEVSVEDGPVPDALHAYAKRNKVDLIVMSSHGRGGIARLSLGSVTDSLIRHTTIPVLVVKPHPSYVNSQPHAFKRIVVSLDGSSVAEQVLPGVVALARVDESELTLLRVVVPRTSSQKTVANEYTPWWDTEVAAAEAYLFRTADKLREDGLRTRTDVVIGENVAKSIAGYAARESADLLAIATHGRGGMSRALIGSVADALTRTSHTSLLVLRAVGSVPKKAPATGAHHPDGVPVIA